jgi:hypothetical protein
MSFVCCGQHTRVGAKATTPRKWWDRKAQGCVQPSTRQKDDSSSTDWPDESGHALIDSVAAKCGPPGLLCPCRDSPTLMTVALMRWVRKERPELKVIINSAIRIDGADSSPVHAVQSEQDADFHEMDWLGREELSSGKEPETPEAKPRAKSEAAKPTAKSDPAETPAHKSTAEAAAAKAARGLDTGLDVFCPGCGTKPCRGSAHPARWQSRDS